MHNLSIHQKPLNSVLVKPSGPDCNMDCVYCFYLEKSELYPQSKKHRMSETVLKEMTRQLMSQNIPHISIGWQGGEPSLMGLPFFEKAIEYQQQFGQEKSVANGFQTNGILLDKNWATFFRKYNFLIGLSLDGPEHVHDHYRVMNSGQGTWAKVADRAKMLLDNGVNVNAMIVLNDKNTQFAEEIYNFHKNLGLTHMQFIPCMETVDGNPQAVKSFSVSPEGYGTALCTLFDLWRSDFVNDEPSTSIRFFDSVFYSYVDLVPPDCTLLKECGNYVVVEHNGDVYSCDFYVEPGQLLGNIGEHDMVEMVNSNQQNAFGSAKAVLSNECKSCEWLKHCRGGCPKYRIVPTETEDLLYFCSSYKQFFSHADSDLKAIAENWNQNRKNAVIAERKEYIQSLTAQGPKVQRNDTCPCGSGKKFKHCCGSL
jgi:uncharacterized protein